MADLQANHRLSLRFSLSLMAVMFTITGCAGLLVEQCFEKLLTSLVGASTPAAAIVLSVYFLGLTLGALIYPKVRRRKWRPLQVYGVLEGGIGCWAVILSLSHAHLTEILTPLLRIGGDTFLLLQTLRFIVACVWILPPTLLMGATFPAMIDALEVGRVPSPRKVMSLFYSLNLGGAILGAVSGPYYFFPNLGLLGTLWITALLDLSVSASVFWMMERGTRMRVYQASTQSTAFLESLKASRFSVLLVIGFFSGFLVFALEVLWTHLIGAVLGNSVYAFAAMLAIVLISLFFGGWLSIWLFSERKPLSPLSTSALLLIASCLLSWQYRQWDGIPNEMIVWGMGLTVFKEGEVLRWMQTTRLIAPPSILLGMVYPTLFRMSFFPVFGRAKLAALLGGVNSIGCVLGALVCGFVMIPLFGAERSLFSLGLLALISGWALSAWYGRRNLKIGVSIAACLVLVAWVGATRWNRLSLTSGGHVYFKPAFVGPNTTLLFFQEDTMGGITTVVQEPSRVNNSIQMPPVKTLLTNGKFQANDAGETRAQTGFALVPILHVDDPQDALVIGLGSGHSAEIVRKFGFPSIDIAEIAPGIIEAARRHFNHINGNILDQPGVQLHLEDGRNVLLLNEKQYDLITMEISSVWFAGSTSLYCREFYELCKKRLKPGGVMQQWIQVHHLGSDELGSVIATMHEVFPYVSFWMVGGQGILIGTSEPQKLRQAAVEAYFRANPWDLPTEDSQKEELKKILSTRLLSPEDTQRLLRLQEFPINTDSNRYLEYATPKYNLDRRPLDRLNIQYISRFATFASQTCSPGWPAIFKDAAEQITPDLQRQVLRLPNLNAASVEK